MPERNVAVRSGKSSVVPILVLAGLVLWLGGGPSALLGHPDLGVALRTLAISLFTVATLLDRLFYPGRFLP